MNQSIMDEEQQENGSKESLDTFFKRLETLESAEDKLKASITYMQEALSQKITPNFKGFWEVRKICLPLFKDSLTSPLRSQLWGEYIELTREGRRLKNILDEETAFAVEQIDLAIANIEEEVKAHTENLEEFLSKAPIAEIPQSPSLANRYPYYKNTQTRLNGLNLFASRINALRKELLKTEMRIRQKNKFFQRLSTLGDLIFPPRKDLIKEISDAFLEDVNHFVEEHFSPETFSPDAARRSVFFFREEIKILQSIAKILSLNTHAFSQTREKLSHCWDMLKGMEKELKKEFAEQKLISSENAALVKEKIQDFKNAIEENQLSLEEGYQELEGISRWMRDLELTRFDVKILREELKEARQPLDAELEKQEDERKQKEAAFENARKEKVAQFRESIESLKTKLASENAENLSKELDELKKIFTTLSLTKSEKQHFDRSLKTIRDHIEEKQEKAILDLSADDRAVLDDLNDILLQRRERRKEIKSQMEEYRKIIGGSALDFEKAMRYNELMAAEKERLAKVDEGIKEIERKIRDFLPNYT